MRCQIKSGMTENNLLTYLPTNLLTNNTLSLGEGSAKKRAAFTLAEALITLGIIGVVAAMTMPSVIHNFQKRALETQYKKSVSIINQAILYTKQDMGIENLVEYCTQLTDAPEGEREYYNASECLKSLQKNSLKTVQNKYAWGANVANITRNYEDIKTYNSKQTLGYMGAITNPIELTNTMPDGSFLNYWITESNLYIVVDTNGHKKPNKLGHDIFIFTLDRNKDILSFNQKPKELSDEEIENMNGEWVQNRAGAPCSLTSKQKGNGIGCAWYALRDECPYDSSKRYFECLP